MKTDSIKRTYKQFYNKYKVSIVHLNMKNDSYVFIYKMNIYKPDKDGNPPEKLMNDMNLENNGMTLNRQNFSWSALFSIREIVKNKQLLDSRINNF